MGGGSKYRRVRDARAGGLRYHPVWFAGDCRNSKERQNEQNAGSWPAPYHGVVLVGATVPPLTIFAL